jgi:hypothetical protein
MNPHRALARLVARVRTPVALLLVALWFPITAHCQLESMGVLPALVHCAGDCSADDESSQADSDACGVLESASYRIDETRLGLPVIDASVFFHGRVADFVLPAEAPFATPAPAPSPPILAANWRFLCRAALPPRAPSLAS